MDDPVEKLVGAENLLALHDELDALDKRESYTTLAVVFFLVAAALFVFGANRESVYLLVNGLLSAVGGIVLGGWELSKLRKKRALRREVQEVERRQLPPCREELLDGGQEPPNPWE